MRRLSPEEADLWQRAMRDVAPLRGHRPLRAAALPEPRPAPAVPPTPPAEKLKPPRVAVVRPPLPLPPLDRFAGIDRASAERLKRGRYIVEAKLDLHGLTQAEAHSALARFVSTSRARGRRCVLIITGHGRTTGGILKGAVPRWLNEPGLRHHLLAVTPAQPRDGGTAALYLLLRRLPQLTDQPVRHAR
jgi:DNA-nicking Smr family endonuclease